MPSPCHCSAIMILIALAARRWRKISTRIMPHCVAQLQFLQLPNIYLVTCRDSPKTSLKRTSSPRKFAPRNATLHATEILARMAVASRYNYANQGTQGNRWFHPYQRTRNDFFSKGRPPRTRLKKEGESKRAWRNQAPQPQRYVNC